MSDTSTRSDEQFYGDADIRMKPAVFLYERHWHAWTRDEGVWSCYRRRFSPRNESCPVTHPITGIWPPSSIETDAEKRDAFARAGTPLDPTTALEIPLCPKDGTALNESFRCETCDGEEEEIRMRYVEAME